MASACAHQRTGQIEYYRADKDGALKFVEELETGLEGAEKPAPKAIEKGKPVAIILKRGFIRYLRTFHDNGEVAVVVTTSEFGEPKGKQRLIEYFENQRQTATLNFRDTIIYGPTVWSGKSLKITIQLIEIDSDKYPLMSQYLKTVANTVRTAFPQYSAAVSIAASVGEFLVKEISKDDEELTFHFTLFDDEGKDPQVPTLMTGDYVAIKSEWGRNAVEFAPIERLKDNPDVTYELSDSQSKGDYLHFDRISLIDPILGFTRWILGIFVPSPWSVHVKPQERVWDQPRKEAPKLTLKHGDLFQSDGDKKLFRARSFMTLHVTDALLPFPEAVQTYMEAQAQEYKNLLTLNPEKIKEIETMSQGFVQGLKALSLAQDARVLARNDKATDLSKAALWKRICEFSREGYEKNDVSNVQYLIEALGGAQPSAPMKEEYSKWSNLLLKKPQNCDQPPPSK
jgi:hypothetical protein